MSARLGHASVTRALRLDPIRRMPAFVVASLPVDAHVDPLAMVWNALDGRARRFVQMPTVGVLVTSSVPIVHSGERSRGELHTHANVSIVNGSHDVTITTRAAE
jgi:hypothetical protein